ncbi:MAG: DUF1841 family protein [Kangiellaceae bacterium]|nr:DUF1841 family protein [Kangiellaceae bacterium]
MFFSNDRKQLREEYFSVWSKHQSSAILTPLESQILSVIQEHPEYQLMFDNREKFLEQDFSPEMGETNPFLHMALHLSIREQESTNRQNGMKKIVSNCIQHFADRHQAEHFLMDALVESIWQSQKAQQSQQTQLPQDDKSYLKLLKKHLRKHNIG